MGDVLSKSEVAALRARIVGRREHHTDRLELADSHEALRAERDLYSGLLEDSERGRRALVAAAQALVNGLVNIPGPVNDLLADEILRLRRIVNEQVADGD